MATKRPGNPLKSLRAATAVAKRESANGIPHFVFEYLPAYPSDFRFTVFNKDWADANYRLGIAFNPWPWNGRQKLNLQPVPGLGAQSYLPNSSTARIASLRVDNEDSVNLPFETLLEILDVAERGSAMLSTASQKELQRIRSHLQGVTE
jgi:hypothetical protein